MNRNNESFFDLDLEPDPEEAEANYWMERLHVEAQDSSRKGRKPRNRRKDWPESDRVQDEEMI